jgi:hypothetical protein
VPHVLGLDNLTKQSHFKLENRSLELGFVKVMPKRIRSKVSRHSLYNESTQIILDSIFEFMDVDEFSGSFAVTEEQAQLGEVKVTSA